MPEDAYDKIMHCNVKANIQLCNKAAPLIVSRGGGSIIIVSSIAGFHGSEMLGAYGISKAADFALIRNLALEWGPKGIRANAIAPGLIKTDFSRALWETRKWPRRLRTTPRPPHRRPFRTGRCGGLSGLQGSLLYHRAGHHCGWWPHRQGTGLSNPALHRTNATGHNSWPHTEPTHNIIFPGRKSWNLTIHRAVRPCVSACLNFMDKYIYPNDHVYHEEIAENRRKGNPWVPVQIIEDLKPKAARRVCGTCSCPFPSVCRKA